MANLKKLMIAATVAVMAMTGIAPKAHAWEETPITDWCVAEQPTDIIKFKLCKTLPKEFAAATLRMTTLDEPTDTWAPNTFAIVGHGIKMSCTRKFDEDHETALYR